MPTARKRSKKKNDNEADDTTMLPEKRQCRYRTTCPAKVAERLGRANTQRMYLIQQTMDHIGTVCEFSVLGSTGNVYVVKLQTIPSCNCPDFSRHQDLCKHIIFVLLKVIGLPPNNPLAFQKAYLQSELNELMELLRNRRVGGRDSIQVMANEEVQRNFARLTQEKSMNSPSHASNKNVAVKRRSLEVSDDCDCPVCFDKMDINDTRNPLTYCQAACGTNFHLECIHKWFKNSSTTKSCPNCRQEWIGSENPREAKRSIQNDGNYINLGTYQGVSPVRDTSTYHSYEYKRRRYR